MPVPLPKMEVEGSVQVRTQVMSDRDVANPESFTVRRGAMGGCKAELSPESIAFVDRTVLALCLTPPMVTARHKPSREFVQKRAKLLFML